MTPKVPTPASFAEWEDAIGIRRTAVLLATVWMTWRAFEWAGAYAATHSVDANGLGIAAVIAAVTAPITYLQVAVFKAYLDAKGTA